MAVQLQHLTPDLVNRRYPVFDKVVTQELLSAYFDCLGYSAGARAEVPASFFACFREAEFKVFEDLGIELRQLLHVSQNYSYFFPLKLGDKVQSLVTIERVSSRKMGSGLVVFIDLKNTYLREGIKVAEADGTVIVREAQ